jgi:uncharacterized membrane protein YidH (DUF202 family)
MPSPDGHERERGLARERSGLAWERTGLAFAGLGGVVLGVAAHHDAPSLLAVSAALLGVATAVWRHGRIAYERASVGPQPRVLGLLTLATALAALSAAVVVILKL